MDFLTTRHMYHGVFASRNVLLTENLEAKISDFGLSKRLYSDIRDPQTMPSTEDSNAMPLPIKWMALEVLLHGEFVHVKTDIWSYGILVWEIFDYGREPYRPGIMICYTFPFFSYLYGYLFTVNYTLHLYIDLIYLVIITTF